MKIKQATKVLSDHNIWRRGGKGKMTEPKELGIAIDTIVAYHKQSNKMYSKETFLKAAELGETSIIDAKHIVSLLDEAKQLKNKIKLKNKKK